MKQTTRFTALAATALAGTIHAHPAAAQDCGTAGTITVPEMT